MPPPRLSQFQVDVVAEGGRVPSVSWPISRTTDWLRISGDLSPEEVGLFVARWADHFVTTDEPAESVAELLVADAPDRTVTGGLRLLDTVNGTEVLPGCCSGIEDWRTWADAVGDGVPYLGHNGPWVEEAGDWLWVWPSGDEDNRAEMVREGEPVVVRRSDLGGILLEVQGELLGFLDRLEAWASEYCPGQTAALVEAADRTFAVRGCVQVCLNF